MRYIGENTMQDLTIVIPCYEEKHEIIDAIIKEFEKLAVEVIVVDDGSKEPYPTAIKHGVNFGYGGSLLTGIKNATRPLIITMDGDGQHRVGDAVNLYIAWKMMKDCDLLIGSRRMKDEEWHRMWGRKFLNLIASVFATFYFQDLNSGMRIFKKDIAFGYRSILCRTFSFTTSLTMSMICDGYRVESFPIEVNERKYGESKVNVLKHGMITLYYIVIIGLALRTRRLRLWWRKIVGKK